HRVADHRAELREQAADLRRDVAVLPWPDLERLDRVGHAWTRNLLEGVDHVLASFIELGALAGPSHSSGTAASPPASSLGGLGGARSAPIPIKWIPVVFGSA